MNKEKQNILNIIEMMELFTKENALDNGASQEELDSALYVMSNLKDIINQNENGKHLLEMFKDYQINNAKECASLELGIVGEFFTITTYKHAHYSFSIGTSKYWNEEDLKPITTLYFNSLREFQKGLKELCSNGNVYNIFTTQDRYFLFKAMKEFQSLEDKALDCKANVYECFLDDGSDQQVGKSVYIRAFDKSQAESEYLELINITQGYDLSHKYYVEDKEEKMSVIACLVTLE